MLVLRVEQIILHLKFFSKIAKYFRGGCRGYYESIDETPAVAYRIGTEIFLQIKF